MPHSTEPQGIKIVPHVLGKDKSGVKFGATVTGVDLNKFTGKYAHHLGCTRFQWRTKDVADDEFKIIEEALYTHKILVFKEQPTMLLPSQQYKLTKS